MKMYYPPSTRDWYGCVGADWICCKCLRAGGREDVAEPHNSVMRYLDERVFINGRLGKAVNFIVIPGLKYVKFTAEKESFANAQLCVMGV
jgi:hypothetical protein